MQEPLNSVSISYVTNLGLGASPQQQPLSSAELHRILALAPEKRYAIMESLSDSQRNQLDQANTARVMLEQAMAAALCNLGPEVSHTEKLHALRCVRDKFLEDPSMKGCESILDQVYLQQVRIVFTQASQQISSKTLRSDTPTVSATTRSIQAAVDEADRLHHEVLRKLDERFKAQKDQSDIEQIRASYDELLGAIRRLRDDLQSWVHAASDPAMENSPPLPNPGLRV
jgi:hypothetical protein